MNITVPDIRTLGDVVDPARLEEVWTHDLYRAAGHIHSGSVVVDLGANVGSFTIWAALRGAVVLAVEPHAGNVAQLRVNLARAGVESQVTVLEAAIGQREGYCRLACYPEADESLGTYAVAGRGPVEMWTLERLLEPYPFVDVLKADIEGAEYSVFPSAPPSVLARIGYATMEVHSWQLPGGKREGIGFRTDPPKWNPDGGSWIIRAFAATHHVDLYGSFADGGLLFADRIPREN